LIGREKLVLVNYVKDIELVSIHDLVVLFVITSIS